MAYQNRVTPFGEIVEAPWRGAMLGNRGILHNADAQLGVSRWRHQNWVCCVLDFKGRRRKLMTPGRYTELFFWDEAAAFAAGHRPCGECRRAEYRKFMDAWRAVGLPGRTPKEVDRHLHRHRVERARAQVRYQAQTSDLPDGVFVVVPEGEHMPMLWWQGALYHLSLADGQYYAAGKAPDRVTVLTPRPTVEVLRQGYVPSVRLSADRVNHGPNLHGHNPAS